MLVAPADVALAPAVLESLDDAALVTLAQAGDQVALVVLCERMRPLVIAALRARTGTQLVVLEDIASEVVFRLLTHLDAYQPVAGVPFRAWVYRIARNLLTDSWRRQATPRGGPREVGMGELIAWAARPGAAGGERAAPPWELALAFVTRGRAVGDGGSDKSDEADRPRAVAAALAMLTPDQRRCVELRWLRGQSIAETARLMLRGEEAIKQLQVRAFRRLQPLLAEYAPGAPA